MCPESDPRNDPTLPTRTLPADGSIPLEAKQRIDQVCLAFEDAWKAGEPPQIEKFLGDTAEPERSALLGELLRLELDYLHWRGEALAPEPYQARFPDHQTQIAEVFQEHLARVAEVQPPGTKIRYFGDYELLEEIGRGGMGVVYKARQVSLNRVVALKMILAGQLADDEDIKRFHAEAEAAAQLDHPGIVPIYEVGQHEGQHYFSMGFVEGQSLAARVAQGPLPPREAAELVRAVAEAVHYAHQKGVIHRDLKPGNILLAKSEVGSRQADSKSRPCDFPIPTPAFTPRITDFGLAKRVTGESGLTVTGQVLGTASYMPPEQASGKLDQIGPTSDVYALGAVLYTLLAGRPPFQAATPAETVVQVLNQEPVSLRSLNAGTPRDLETITLRCLEKDLRRRYATAQDVTDELRRYLAGEPIYARPVSRPERLWRWCKRKPVVAALSAAVLVLFVAGTAISTYFAVEASNRAEEASASAKRADREAQEASAARDRQFAHRLEAERKTRLASAERLTAQAREAFDEYPQRSLLLAVEALETTLRHNEGRVPGAEQALRTALGSVGGRPLREHPGPVHQATISSDNRWLLTLADNAKAPTRTMRFDDLTTPAEYGRVAYLWDLTAKDPAESLTVLGGHNGGVRFAEISPDSRWAITTGSFLEKMGRRDTGDGVFMPVRDAVLGTGDNTARLWNLTASQPGTAVAVLRGHEREIRCVAISPDSRWAVTGSGDRTARLWSLVAKDPAAGSIPLRGHEGPVTILTISPDSRWLVTANPDGGTARLWDLKASDPGATSIVLGVLGSRTVSSISGPFGFSPDARWLALGSQRGLSLLDLTSKDPTAKPISVRGRPVSGSTAFSPDSRWLVTAVAEDSGKLLTKAADFSALKLNPRLWDLKADDPAAASLLLPVHEKQIEAAVFSVDNHWLVTFAGKGRLWDLTAKDPSAAPIVLEGSEQGEVRVLHVGFSPNSRWLAVSNQDGAARLWDLAAKDRGARPVVLSQDEGAVGRAGLQPSTGPLLPGYVQRRWYASTAFISPDSRWLITRGRTPRLWDLTAKDPAAGAIALRGHDGPTGLGAFSGDSHWLVTAAGFDRTVRVWDLAAGVPAAAPVVLREEAISTASRKQLPSVRGSNTPAISSLPISPDSRWLVTAGEANTVCLRDLKAKDLAAAPIVLRGHKGAVYGAEFSPDARWLVTTDAPPFPDIARTSDVKAKAVAVSGWPEYEARLWDLKAKDPAAAPVLLRGRRGRQIRTAFSADNRWLATAAPPHATVHLWDLKAQDPAAHPLLLPADSALFHEVVETPLVMSPDSRWVVIADSSTMHVWDLTARDPSAAPIRFPVARTRDADPDELERIRRVKSPFASTSARIQISVDMITSITISQDSRWLIVASDDATVRVWDLKAIAPAAVPLTLRGRDKGHLSVVISPSARWLVTTEDATPVIASWRIQGAPKLGAWLSIQRTGTVATNSLVRLWDLTAKDPAATATVLPTRGKIHHVAISPDSRWLVTGSRDGHTGHLWDLAANAPGEAPIALEHDQGITSVAYTPDNQRLATGTSGGTLRLWDLTARFPASALVALPAHKGAVRALAVSPDNRYLVSGGDDKTVRVWNLQLKELMDQARRVAGRALSEEERRTYMLSEPVEQGKAER